MRSNYRLQPAGRSKFCNRHYSSKNPVTREARRSKAFQRVARSELAPQSGTRSLCCPRCGAELAEIATPKWLPFFECRRCFRAFELVVERHRAPTVTGGWFLRSTVTLQPGRTARPAMKGAMG